MKRCFLLVLILLVACNNEQEIETAVQQTVAAQTPIIEPVEVTVVVEATVEATAEVIPTALAVTMNELVQGDDYQGVIFQVDNGQAEGALTGFVSEYDAYRQATAAEIAQLEGGLLTFLQADYPQITERLPQYIRQYVGFARDGDLLVFMNAMCSEPTMDWQNHMIYVLDGGSCYFQLVYDVTNDAFVQFSVNGES